MTLKKEINKEFLAKIRKLKLKGIKFEVLNNVIIPTISGVALFKGTADRMKLLLYLAKIIISNKPVSVKTLIFYLEKSTPNRIKLLKLLNQEVEKEPLLQEWIIEKELPYIIKELEEEVEKDIYTIIDENGNKKNLIFDFIEKVKNKTGFLFSDKFPITIARNIKDTKKWIKDNNVSLEDLEWFFDKVYTTYIYDGTTHKSIKWFLVSADEYFLNKKEYQTMIKGLMFYLKEKKENRSPLAIGNAFSKNKQALNSILTNIGWNLQNFEAIIKEANRKYSQNSLSWTLNTIFNNLFSQYAKYVVTDKSTNSKDNKEEYTKEFKKFIIDKGIKDKDIIKQYYSIYLDEGIEGIKDM